MEITNVCSVCLTAGDFSPLSLYDPSSWSQLKTILFFLVHVTG